MTDNETTRATAAEWPGDGREPCGCNGTPHFLTPACLPAAAAAALSPRTPVSPE